MSGTRELPRLRTAHNVTMGSADDGVGCDETARIGRNWKVILGIAATALLVLTLQYLWRRHLSAIDEYDDGVYFGASIQPLYWGGGPTAISPLSNRPVITAVDAPFAALFETGRARRSQWRTARFFVDLVSVTNVVLVGALVRRRSMMQVILATGIIAFLRALSVRHRRSSSSRSSCLACLRSRFLPAHGWGKKVTVLVSSPLVVGGVLFGVAGATKVWAVLTFPSPVSPGPVTLRV